MVPRESDASNWAPGLSRFEPRFQLFVLRFPRSRLSLQVCAPDSGVSTLVVRVRTPYVRDGTRGFQFARKIPPFALQVSAFALWVPAFESQVPNSRARTPGCAGSASAGSVMCWTSRPARLRVPRSRSRFLCSRFSFARSTGRCRENGPG